MPLQCFHKSSVSLTHQTFSGYDRATVEIFRAASSQVVIPYLLSKHPLVPRVSLTVGREYGMKQWNRNWNGKVN